MEIKGQELMRMRIDRRFQGGAFQYFEQRGCRESRRPKWGSPEVMSCMRGLDFGQLRDKDVRIATDLSDQRMNAKIRSAQNQKIPYMIILGEKEQGSEKLSIRTRGGEQIQELSIEKFLTLLHDG